MRNNHKRNLTEKEKKEIATQKATDAIERSFLMRQSHGALADKVMAIEKEQGKWEQVANYWYQLAQEKNSHLKVWQDTADSLAEAGKTLSQLPGDIVYPDIEAGNEAYKKVTDAWEKAYGYYKNLVAAMTPVSAETDQPDTVRTEAEYKEEQAALEVAEVEA